MARRRSKKKAETGNTPNREELYRMAVHAARNKQYQGARMMFQQLLAQTPDNERVLMWMAKISRSKGDRRKWLNRVLDVNPSNAAALTALEKMDTGDLAARNRNLLRIGVGVYGGGLLVICLLAIIITLFSG